MQCTGANLSMMEISIYSQQFLHLAFLVECNELVPQDLVIAGDEVDRLLAGLLQAMLQVLLWSDC